MFFHLTVGQVIELVMQKVLFKNTVISEQRLSQNALGKNVNISVEVCSPVTASFFLIKRGICCK